MAKVDDKKKFYGQHPIHQCLHPRIVNRALGVALVVGTVLNLINHYDLILGAVLSSSTVIQMALTYLVPYIVSTHGQVSSHFDNFRKGVQQ
jgi:type IV secretory pathway TrbF-like protein